MSSVHSVSPDHRCLLENCAVDETRRYVTLCNFTTSYFQQCCSCLKCLCHGCQESIIVSNKWFYMTIVKWCTICLLVISAVSRWICTVLVLGATTVAVSWAVAVQCGWCDITGVVDTQSLSQPSKVVTARMKECCRLHPAPCPWPVELETKLREVWSHGKGPY